MLGDVLTTLVGEGEALAPGTVVGLDQPLVLQLLDRRVDRAGARPPGPVAALGDLLDDLVAVELLAVRLGRPEDVEDRGAHVAAADPRATPLVVRRAQVEQAGHPRRRALPAGTVPAAEVTPGAAAASAATLASSGLVGASPLSVESLVSHLGTPSLTYVSECLCVSRMHRDISQQYAE